MRKVTSSMIKEFEIKKLGYDFMGYHLNKGDAYNFHHLIVSNRDGGPYARWNGAILCSKSSHPYLHLIENMEYERFCYITSEMIDMNVKGYLDPANLHRIHDILCEFEFYHASDRGNSGKLLIKEEYRRRIVI